MIPHNLGYAVLGAALLWFGWMGFNGGSGLAADGLAANAIIVSNVAAALGLIVWTGLDTYIVGKPTVLGAISGAVAGLVAITPAAGFVDVRSNGNWCSGSFRVILRNILPESKTRI